MPFKRILIAVDFSPNSLEAFRVAADMASVHSASLHLLHVIEAWPAAPGEAAKPVARRVAASKEAGSMRGWSNWSK